MDERLYKATIEGNTETLLMLIQQDPLILERTNTITTTYLETPLHIAALLGHESFAVELLKRKPGLVREVDSSRSSALHLGSAKGHLGIVRALLRADPNMCFACNRDGRNPVHVAAMMGRVDVLKEMLAVEPEAARAVVKHGGGGTILHLCVEYCQFEVLKIVMEKVDFQKLVNNKDRNGNTVLHLAVADKQVESTELLLSVPRIDFNAVNLSGMTPMDILIQRGRDVRDLEIEETLKHAGAIGGMKSISTTLFHTNKEKPNPHCPCKTANKNVQKKSQTKNQDDWLDKKRSALMVVASLIATMAFQVGVNPPANVWLDTQTATNSTQTLANTTESNKPLFYVRKVSNFLKKGERFYIINTISFIASLSIILLLMSGLPLKSKFFVWILLMITWVAISDIALSYTVAVVLLTPPEKEKTINAMVGVTVFAWICLMTLLLFGHTARLFVKMVRMVLRMVKSLFGRRRSSGLAVYGNNSSV